MSTLFKQTDIGLIPKDWDYLKLGDEDRKLLSVIRNGCTVEQNDSDGDYLVSRIETISDEKIDLLKTKFIKEISEDKIDKYLIRKGDILFSHINSDPHLGKTAIAYKDYDNLLHGMNLLLFHSNEDVLDPDFLNYIFNYFRRIGVFLKIRSRAVNQSSINQGKLKSLEIPLPPLPEQKKIAHVLSKIQQAIEIQEQIIKTTQELKKALMQKFFTEGLNGEPQKQTEIGLIPESWEVVSISDLGQVVTGTTPKTAEKKYYSPKEIDFIAPADIGTTKYIYDSTKKISNAGLGVCRSLPKSSVVCVCIGSTIGKVGLTYKNISTTNQQINSIICSDNYNPVFVYYMLNYYASYWRTFASPNPVPILSKGKFEQIEIPITKNSSTQSYIANTLSNLDDKIEYSSGKKNILIELFQNTLNKLMTGQIRTGD